MNFSQATQLFDIFAALKPNEEMFYHLQKIKSMHEQFFVTESTGSRIQYSEAHVDAFTTTTYIKLKPELTVGQMWLRRDGARKLAVLKHLPDTDYFVVLITLEGSDAVTCEAFKSDFILEHYDRCENDFANNINKEFFEYD